MTRSATDAWHTLGGDPPDRVEVLKQDGSTTICRLTAVGDDGRSVIAKRAPWATAGVERVVYEKCLTGFPLPILRYYGAVEEPEHCWLFVEEARGAKFHPDKPKHRAAAARWLAALHTSLHGLPRPSGLPDRRSDHYLRLLRSQRESLRRELPDPALGALAEQCDRVSASWAELEDACRGAPDTLVHGDIVAHNALLREGSSGLEFLPFDWEKAGWGPAAEDITIVDLEVYAAAVGTRPDAALRRLASAGRIFRCLVFLDWVLPGLHIDRATAIEQISLCTAWMKKLMDRARWRS